MIKVKVPATTANLCIGYDCLGMALDWWSTFTFEQSTQLRITGCDPRFQTKDNLVLRAFYTTCEYLQKEKPVFHLDIQTDIPNSRGFGSSAMCIVAGIVGCDAWFHAGLNRIEMLEIATGIEGHPDNVGPAIFGQALTAFIENEQTSAMVIPCADWTVLAMIPDYEIPTKQARKVLPKSLPHGHAVKQVAHALGFVQALQVGNEKVLVASCQDYLHEPYRRKLLPEYDKVRPFCQKNEIAHWISGSGSAMVFMSMEKKKLEALKEYIEKELQVSCRSMQIARKGAYAKYE